MEVAKATKRKYISGWEEGRLREAARRTAELLISHGIV